MIKADLSATIGLLTRRPADFQRAVSLQFDDVDAAILSFCSRAPRYHYNFGNIRTGSNWFGLCGSARGFCMFCTRAQGLRALCVLLQTYMRRGWLGSPEVFVSHYAPAPDGNDTASYVAFVRPTWTYYRHGSVGFMVSLVWSILKIEHGNDAFRNEKFGDFEAFMRAFLPCVYHLDPPVFLG